MSSNKQLLNKGLWIFIFFDFLLFAGLLAYHIANSVEYSADYSFAKSQLLLSFGFFNTLILFSSGLTIGLSKVAYFNKNNFLSVIFVFVTFVFAMIFIANRAIDCTYLYSKGYLLGSDSFGELNGGLQLFFTTYFASYFFFMIHLFIGIVLLLMLLVKLIKYYDDSIKQSKLNFTVLYWSYLTMIWAFIFPILFLI